MEITATNLICLMLFIQDIVTHIMGILYVMSPIYLAVWNQAMECGVWHAMGQSQALVN